MLWPQAWERDLRGESGGLLEALLPHRGPMLLIDELVGWTPEEKILGATRRIDEAHLGLEGHFPGDPVLPGTLLVEMMGQAGVALFGLVLWEEEDEELTGVRATKILGAHFLREIRPGEEVSIVVEATRWDAFLGECRAQALVDGEIAAVMAGEVTPF